MPTSTEEILKNATARPWKQNTDQRQMIIGNPPNGWITTRETPLYIVAQTGLYTSTLPITSSINAELIVRAVNEYEFHLELEEAIEISRISSNEIKAVLDKLQSLRESK